MSDRTGQQIGNYRLVRLLGRGAFAEVYLGEHRYLKSHAALKVLRTSVKDEDMERLLSEAQTLVHLIHPNVVRVLEFVVERGTPVLIMDYASGGTARAHFPRGSCLSLTTTVSYIKQIAAALQYAHNSNIIHRDVKPENILIGSGQHILLSDFGIALLAPSPELLSTQDMAGTLPYTAPEQLRGRAVFASDQYALGIVAYEWLCGRRPFEGSPWEIMHAHVHTAPPPLRERYPELPAGVESVVLRALTKDPQERFVSVQAFARALERAGSVSTLDNLDQSEVTAPLRVHSDSPFATFSEKTPRGIFLSASPADDAFAARLEAELKARGVPIVRGRDTSDGHETSDSSREEAIRQAIRASDIALVVISPDTRSSRTVQEQLRIIGMYERQLVFVWASGDDLATLLPEAWGKSAVVDLIDAREARYQLALEEIVARLSQGSFSTEPVRADTPPRGPMHAPLQSEPRNPYKGLRAFTNEDSSDFFGRDALIQELAQTIQHTLAPAQPEARGARLLAVVGPSGSGKSSLVMAGLLPQLSKGLLPGSEQWAYLEPMVPEKHPLESLAFTLAPHLPNRSLKTIREDLEDDSGRGLHLLATQMERQVGARVVLMIDQFEEVFTSSIPEAERQQFIDVLVTAVTEPRGPVMVILTLRADFYDRPLSYPALAQLLQQHHHLVLPMDIQDLRAIIEQPAALPDVQLTFEGNLVGDMLFDAQGQAGALPLLEFTLNQLFQRREGHWLTLQAYQQIGGVKGALAKQAESTYASLPSAEHRRLARALFLRLIDPGITEQDTTRRRATLPELSLPDPKHTTLMRESVDAFIAARLLTTNMIEGITTIEVSHEALIREWARLAEWLREAREDIPLQQIISADAADWERRGCPDDRVYSGSELTESLAWAKRNVPSIQEMTFLNASVTEQKRQEQLEQSRQARELKLKRQTVNRLRSLVAVLSLFLVVSIVFASVLQVLRVQDDKDKATAVAEALNATSRALAANANTSLLQGKLDLALLLSVKAYQTAHTFEARDSLLSALQDSPQIVTMLRSKYKAPISLLTFGSDGHTVIASDGSRVYIWDTNTKQGKLLSSNTQEYNYVGAIALSPDNRTLALSSASGVWLWNIQTRTMLHKFDITVKNLSLGSEAPTALAFSPDGQRIESALCSLYATNQDIPQCLQTQVAIWNVHSGQLVSYHTFQANGDTATFSPDGQKLATNDGVNIQTWDASTGQPLGAPLTSQIGSLQHVAFSPDGQKLAASSQTTIELWNLITGQPFGTPLTNQAHSFTNLAFSPDGQKLAASSQDKTISVWNIASPQLERLFTLNGNGQAQWSVSFGPDGASLISGSDDGTLLLWNLDAQNTFSRQLADTSMLQSPIFSPDGTRILTGSRDGKVLFFDVKTGKLVDTLDTMRYSTSQSVPDNLRPIVSLALSRDGSILATGRLDGTIFLWNMKTQKVFAQFVHPNQLNQVLLSADGHILAASGAQDSISLWDVTKETRLHVLPYYAASPLRYLPIALSPDGKLLAVGGCGEGSNANCDPTQVQLLDVSSGKAAYHPLTGHQFPVSAVAFSPDGRTLASSAHDGIILWSAITTNSPTHQMLLPPTNTVGLDYYSNLLFSSNGNILASYSRSDSSLSFILWDVAMREPLAHAISEDNFYQAGLAFSPNGQQLATVATLKTAPGQGNLSLWDISINAWQEHACAIANRNLNDTEVQQFLKGANSNPVCPNIASSSFTN